MPSQACRPCQQTSYWLVVANETVWVKRILIIVNGLGEKPRIRHGLDGGFSRRAADLQQRQAINTVFTAAVQLSTIRADPALGKVLLMSRSGIQFSVPEAVVGPIDWAHLDRATLGDAKLAREVLGLFDAQAESISETIGNLPANLGMLVHGLKGAARSIGAWPVAEAAQKLEAAFDGAADPAPAVASFLREVCAVRETIAAHLREP